MFKQEGYCQQIINWTFTEVGYVCIVTTCQDLEEVSWYSNMFISSYPPVKNNKLYLSNIAPVYGAFVIRPLNLKPF